MKNTTAFLMFRGQAKEATYNPLVKAQKKSYLGSPFLLVTSFFQSLLICI